MNTTRYLLLALPGKQKIEDLEILDLKYKWIQNLDYAVVLTWFWTETLLTFTIMQQDNVLKLD